jgi:L-ascorbate metabolism protein UlaG (beta-lactamase superfamily)
VRPLGGSFGFSVGELTVEARRLPHEGREYADTVNWGFLLTCGGFTVLHAGDCAVGAPELASLLDGREPDLAILDFPWFTLSRGRRFTEETVRPKHLLLCHLPFAEDDSEGYRPAAAAAAQRTSSIDDVRCLMEPFQREVYI